MGKIAKRSFMKVSKDISLEEARKQMEEAMVKFRELEQSMSPEQREENKVFGTYSEILCAVQTGFEDLLGEKYERFLKSHIISLYHTLMILLLDKKSRPEVKKELIQFNDLSFGMLVNTLDKAFTD